jgi:uncharacterized caspase-like protein
VVFAGHGIEIGGTNYLIPVDAVLKRDIDAKDETVLLDGLIALAEQTNKLGLVIVDACRDNPFASTMVHTLARGPVDRGTPKIEPPLSNLLIAYAAKAGTVAADDQGPYSHFTRALLDHLTTPGLDIRLAFGRVRDAVMKATNNRQQPFVYGALDGRVMPLVEPLIRR